MLTNFRTYQQAKDLYQEGQKLKLKQPLKSQFDRALLSIVLNLAEGSGKASQAERRRFFLIAFGSLRETQAMLDLLGNHKLFKLSDSLAAQIYCLIKNPGLIRIQDG